MRRGRFGLLVGLLVLVVGIASFAAVYLALDGGSDTPSGVDASGPTTTLSVVDTTTTTVPGDLVTPTFVAIVSSEADEATAQALRDELTERGYDSGVLHSDDFTSLDPGYWVAYTGPFADVAAAQAEQVELVADGYTEAYARCVGTADECT